MLRQLSGVAAQPTPLGRLRIGARTESVHDDLPDALSLAVGRLPRQLAEPVRRDPPDGQQWCETPGGIRVPVPVRTLRADVSWFCANADMVRCSCGAARITGHRCPLCGNDGTVPGPAVRAPQPPALPGTTQDADPPPSPWGVTRCRRCDQPYSVDRNPGGCPRCNGGGSMLTFLRQNGKPAGPGPGGTGGMR
jgi:hypothetical protein